jgi:hypothetical protein
MPDSSGCLVFREFDDGHLWRPDWPSLPPSIRFVDRPCSTFAAAESVVFPYAMVLRPTKKIPEIAFSVFHSGHGPRLNEARTRDRETEN